MKVTLEIRADGWTWAVVGNDGSTIATQTMKRDTAGGYRGTAKAAIFEMALEEYAQLFDAIEDECVMDIAQELEYLED